MASLFTKAETTIRVNAAFLQEVKDSNLGLWTTLRDLRAIDPGCEDSIAASHAFVDLIGRLREALALQFSLEETYGYIQASACRFRSLGGADATAAKMQHSELYLQLHELCEQVEEAQYRGTISRDLAAFLGDFEAFDDCFLAHEALEAELICSGLGINFR